MPEIVTKDVDALEALQAEIRTMKALAKWMDQLTPDAQRRVSAWLTAKYGSKES